MTPDRLESNLEALGSRAANSLICAVKRAQPASRLRIERARNDEPVPVLTHNGYDFWFHSQYAPSREASRATRNIPDSQLIITPGVGNGAHIRALLETCNPHAIVVIAEPPELLAGILAEIPLESVLSDERVRIVMAEHAWRTLKALFVPLFTGGFKSVVLEGIRRALPETAGTCNSAVATAADALSPDVSTQSRYGLVWMRNLVANFPQAATRTSQFELPEAVTIAGAGPSLDQWLSSSPDADSIIATDTAAPALHAHHLRPRAVVSVDPALYGYHHILCGVPRNVPWLVDVAAHPAIWRGLGDVVPVAGPHPLLRILLEDMPHAWPEFTGSDVTQAAISISRALGATRILTAGTDYAYPGEQGYARGTYVDTLLSSRSTRLSPFLSQSYDFCYRSPKAWRDSGGTVRTPALEAARRTTSQMMQTTGTLQSQPHRTSDFTPGMRAAIDKLHRISAELSELPRPGTQSATRYYRGLSWREKTLVHACIPTALSLSHRDLLEWKDALEASIGRFQLLVSSLYPDFP